MRDSALLLLFAARHYGYPHLPAQWWGDAFAIAGSVCIIAMVLLLKPWLPLAAWVIGEEALVAGCSAWWIADPWPMLGVNEQCSARMEFKFGAIGLAALALLTYRHALSTFTASTGNGGR